MVRRTKEEALATRRTIIAAAREVFYHNGVTRSSLEMIAAAAGVTRGAIYWHFADKAELFYAMRDEVKLPLVDRSHQSLAGPTADCCPLDRIERFVVTLFDGISSDEAVRRTLWIMTFQCEYVGEFERDLVSAREMHAELKAKLVPLYRAAQRAGLLRPDVTATRAAADTVIFVAGLIRVWLLDDDRSVMKGDVRQLIADHVRGKRCIPRRDTTAAASGVNRAGSR